MKKIVGLIALTAILSACGSEVNWKSVDADGQTDSYIANVEYDKEGSSVTFDLLTDFKGSAQTVNAKAGSAIANITLNCQTQMAVTHRIDFYSEHMGQGRITNSRVGSAKQAQKLDLSDPSNTNAKRLCDRL
ncbi:surface-adhesin E family protein [Brackiella oedipodis]|uniref:surface-adhesin E family protein n=1 Tax=Brackiella oedipodis TaxID=124225 RepID=UPI000491A5DE|nr:surface-adhesin E family protein [Brackiella oedipodis]